MKLHLPKQLFTALLTAFTLAAAPSAWGYDTNIQYVGGSGQSGVLAPEADQATVFTINDAVTSLAKPAGSDLTDVERSKIVDIKLVGANSNGEYEISDVYADSVWFSSARYVVNSNEDLSNAGSLYLCGGLLQVTNDVTFENDIVLGTSTYSESGHSQLSEVSLRIGHWQRASTAVKLAGDVTVAEDTRIVLQGQDSGTNIGGTPELTFSGTLTGSGKIQFDRHKGSAAVVVLAGNTKEYTGVIDLDGRNESQGSMTLKLGSAEVYMGGLESSDAGRTGLALAEGVESSTLTLNVARGSSLTFAGSVGAGISIIKTGEGSQAFSGSMSAFNGSINIQQGTLRLNSSVNNLTSTITGSGRLEIGYNAGTLGAFNDAVFKASGTLAVVSGGVVSMTSGNLNTLTNAIEVDGGQLTLTRSGSDIGKSITVTNNGRLILGATDIMSESATNTISIADSEMNVGGNRIASGAGTKYIFQNAKVTGSGDGHGALDFSGSATITSSGASSIEGALRIRKDKILTINVTDTLTVGTIVAQDNNNTSSLTKTGTGTLVITSMASKTESFIKGTTTISEGTVEYALTADGTYNGQVVGNGILRKSGAAALTLAKVNGFTGDFEVTGGALTINTLAGTNTLNVNLATGTTLTLGTVSAESNIKLKGSGVYVYNVPSGSSNVASLALKASFDEKWSGILRLTGGHKLVNLGAIDAAWTLAGVNVTKVQMQGLHAYAQNDNIDGDIELMNVGSQTGYEMADADMALRLDNGTSTANQSASFTGAISGSGNITYTWTGYDGTNYPNVTTTYKFAGSTQDWEGWFVLSADAGKWTTVEFTAGGVVFGADAGTGGVVDRHASDNRRLSVVIDAKDDADTTFNGSIVNARSLDVRSNATFKKGVEASTVTVDEGVTATMSDTLKASTVNLGTATVTSKTEGGVVEMTKVELSSAGMTGTAAGAAVSNAHVEIQQLAAGVSFTIADMMMTGSRVEAGSEVKVYLDNVEAVNTVLTGGGQFALNAAPTVGTVATAENKGTLSFNTGLSVEAGTTLTLNLDVLNAVGGDEHGTYDLTIILTGFGAGFDFSSITDQVVFDAGSWLGDELRGVIPVVTNSALNEGASAVENSAGAPTLTYTTTAASGDNVGTLVITIGGLNVPEPTTATLSLLALAALAARRRRK